ncbi:hypothetical protein [uncultured Nostoc sp.]|uniref:hypothetical protein n=1 Tax=uncultured Nostoc sp. TaxID=340711 RepID=UPI0035CC95EE
MDATRGRGTAILIGINLTLKRRLETARQSPLLSETLREQVEPALCGVRPRRWLARLHKQKLPILDSRQGTSTAMRN